MADGDVLAVDLQRGQDRELDDLEARRDQARAVVGQALAARGARRRALGQHLAGTGEGGDEVDVAVGVAVLGEALPQPHHPLDAQVVAQPLLDLLARQCRVAVGVQQALLGGQQRPLAVDGHRAALEHEGRFVAAVAEAVDEQPADRLVGVVRRELPTPRVEAEVHAGALAVTVEDEDRSAVAQPRVVDRELDDLDVAGQRGARLAGVLGVGADHGQRLERGDRVGGGGVVGLGLTELGAPDLFATGPAHDGALVGRPLGRHPEAVGCGRAQCRAFRVRLRSSWRSTTLTIRRMYCSTPVALA